MYVFLTINSFKISFCRVPESWSSGVSVSSATTMKLAMIGSTAPFMVIEIEVSFSEIPSKSSFISSTESIATPALPTSPLTRG